jgi:DNA-binding NtrC family response regulator
MERDAVLVIDDDPDFREMVRLLLEEKRVCVLEAPDCATGLALLDREHARVCLVLLDYWMPGKTPADCARCVTQRTGSQIDVVLVTAATDAKKRAAELGIPRYLAKPFDAEQLERIVERAAATRRT